jgi:hypothetical protein
LRDDGGRGVVVDGNEMKSKDMHQKSSELSFSLAMAWAKPQINLQQHKV